MPTHHLNGVFLYKVAQMDTWSCQIVTLRGKQTHRKGLLKQDENEDMGREEEKCYSHNAIKAAPILNIGNRLE